MGLPGSGKSTVGRHLARALGLRFVDADTAVESRIGMPIRTYFETEGEAAFRDVEAAVIGSLCAGSDQIIATGGGVVLREDNRRALKERTIVVYLRSNPNDLARRLKRDTKRPLLQGGDPQTKLRELHAVRDPLYRETANFTVEIGRPSVPMLVNMILMQLELAGYVDAGLVPSPVDAPSMPH
ncbi:MAG: shikimate kinase [Proteobacteria bacterium]|nr:shikimate kinase [Pseudomonadota bacterium]